MNKNTPDFSATLELVDHQLAETEKRLRKKRERDSKAQEGSTEPKGSQSSDKNEVQPETNDEVPKKRKVTAQAKLIPGLKEKNAAEICH